MSAEALGEAGATGDPVPAPPTVGGTVIHAVLLVVGVVAAVVGRGYGVTVPEHNGEVGAGFLPAVAGVLLALFAGAEVLKDLRAARAHRLAHASASGASAVRTGLPVGADLLVQAPVQELLHEQEEVDIFGRTSAQRRKVLVAVSALLLATVLLVPVVGFLIAFGLMLFVISWRVERRRLVPALVTTVVVVAVTRLVFVNFLNVPLPSGLLHIL